MDWVEKLTERFGEKVILNQPLAVLTTLKIGGAARAFFQADTKEELTKIIQFCKENSIPFLVIGGGSNLLVNDDGVDCLVIKNNLSRITTCHPEQSEGYNSNNIPFVPQGDRTCITVSSGTILQDLVNYTIEHGLSGLQKMTGIPGTVGGAVYGNAGAYGQTISDCLKEVAIFDGEETSAFLRNQCRFDYRSSVFKQNKNLIILSVTFELEKSDPEILKKEADEILSQRLKKYPAGIKCPGSFFKNIVASTLTADQLSKIPEDKIVYGKLPAGVLLEAVGAKGDSFKGIEIAPYHANLFINTGEGKAEDFYKLAQKYWLKVKEEFGIELEPEVQLIGLHNFKYQITNVKPMTND